MANHNGRSRVEKEERRVNSGINVPKEFLQWMKIQAAKKGLSISGLGSMVLKEYRDKTDNIQQ